LATSDEVGPVLDLDDGRVVFGRGQVVGKHEAAEWVSCQISTVGVKFTPGVVFLEFDTGLVEEPSDLDVSRRFDELNGCESSGRHDASTVACLGAVCYDLGFDVTDHRVGLRTTPKTEVSDVVDKHGLTIRIGSFCCRIADVVTCLGSSSNRERVHLFRDIRIGKVVLSEG